MLLCYKGRYLLLMKCFITFLTYVKMMERAFDSIYEFPHGPQYAVSANNKYQISNNISSFGYPPSKGNVMMCYKEIHALLLNYSMPSLKYIGIVGRATGILYESLMAYNMSFLSITNIKFHANLRF